MSDKVPEATDSPPPAERIVEAMLFVGGAPLSAARACEVIKGLTEEAFVELIADLNRNYREQGRPYRIQYCDGGYAMTLRPTFRDIRQRLQGGPRETRLSQAALDTLALVAYRQPITRTEIDSLRGADSQTQLRQLVRLGLVSIQRLKGAEEVHYLTTPRFLKLFGLRDLEDLPRTQDIQKF
jgi:segregation and condensation protein B